MLEVAEGVQYIHSEGVVHGDLHGVRTSTMSNISGELASLSTREMCSSIPNCTARLLILDWHDMLKPPFRVLPEHFCQILLLLNYLVCAPSVVSPSAADATRAMVSITQGKRRSRMCMRSVAFIMRCV